MLHRFFINQLQRWPLAADNYSQLNDVATRTVTIDGFPIVLQHNPGRIRSTAAKVSAEDVKKRACFLCSANRPADQISLPLHGSSRYEILVNPFPIAPEHYTIAATAHQYQDLLNPADMELFVTSYPDYLVFYNGSTAGASAPDHLHFQACRKDFVSNLVHEAETSPGQLMKHTESASFHAMTELPMHAVHMVSDAVTDEMQLWLRSLVPMDNNGISPQSGMRNIMMWREDSGKLHTLLFPRVKHRPACFYYDGEDQMMVSPGALDMAGILILPRPGDFMGITAAQIRRIYDEVSIDFRSLPAFQNLMLL